MLRHPRSCPVDSIMLPFIMICTLAFCMGSASGQSQCAGACRNPVYVVGQTVDVYRVNGIWYEYMVGFDQVGYNIVKNGTVRGTYPGAQSSCTTCSYFATWWINYYVPTVPGQAGPNAQFNCTAIWHQGNMTTAGKRYAVSLYGDPESRIGNISTTILFTDYDTVEIVYGCDDFPLNIDGSCDFPLFWVFTRVRPPNLTAAQKAYVQDKIDTYTKPLCYSFAQMKFSSWDLSLTNLPPCNIAQGSPPFPPRFAATMPISPPL